MDAEPASVEIDSEMVYDPATESVHVGLDAVVLERDPADALHEYAPPFTSSKLALDDRSTVPVVDTGFGEPDTEVSEGATGDPEYVLVYVPAVPEVDPETEYPGTPPNDQLMVGDDDGSLKVTLYVMVPPGAALP